MAPGGWEASSTVEGASVGTRAWLSCPRMIQDSKTKRRCWRKRVWGLRQSPSFQTDFIGSGIKQQLNSPWGDSLDQAVSGPIHRQPVAVSSLTFSNSITSNTLTAFRPILANLIAILIEDGHLKTEKCVQLGFYSLPKVSFPGLGYHTSSK